MAYETTTKGVLETILEHRETVSAGGAAADMVDSKEFLPRVRVSESADGLELETFYTCYLLRRGEVT